MADWAASGEPLNTSGSNAPQEEIKNTRTRTGCLTCRYRKKRCNGVRATCGHCQRLNLVCQWERPRIIKIPPEALATSHLSMVVYNDPSPLVLKAPDPMLFWCVERTSEIKTLERRMVLRYFMHTFTKILTTNLENNGFLSVLLPMAVESTPLLDTLIAWTSSHLSLCHESYQVRALEDRSSALTSFAKSLSTYDLPAELSLAGCLILCSMEAILGDTSGWYEHLVGASHVIRPTHVHKSDRTGLDVLMRTLEGRWLLRNFAYHDILMSVSMNCAPLIPGLYWLSEGESIVDSYFGMASQPMAMLSTISSLNSQIRTHPAEPQIESEVSMASHLGYPNVCSLNDSSFPEDSSRFTNFSARAFYIESQLQEWICPESPDRSLINLAEAYRSAALIHLYRTIRQHIPTKTLILNNKIARQVDAIVQHVSNMPVECLPECTLLFPLFVAGGEAESSEHIQYIRHRLTALAVFRRFQNVNVALEVLEDLWQSKDRVSKTEAAMPDWLDILAERGWKLPLS